MLWWQRKKPVKLVFGNFLKPDPVSEDDFLHDVDEIVEPSPLEVEEIRDRILDLLTKGREVRQREVPYLIGWQQGGTQVNEVIDQMVSERLVAIRLSKKRNRMVSLRKKRY